MGTDQGPERGTDKDAKSAVEHAHATPSAGGLIIVGIGASAGGLEALGAMLKNLRLDNSAFVVVQHLSPDHDSLLTDLLARESKLEVVTIRDGVKVEANHVYVIPPNTDLAILHGVLHL